MPETTQEDFLALYQDPRNIPRAAFLTGGAGTGKTYVVSQLLGQLPTNYPYALTAPTGIAALNLGGTTLHSLFQIPFNLRDPRSQAAYNQPRLSRDKRRALEELCLLIIDEVSMVRSDILEYVDETLRRVCATSEPFGGIAILAIGDPFQLPPVVMRHENLPKPWFFQADSWLELAPEAYILTKCYRQSDPAFVNLLNAARIGRTSFDDLRMLGTRLSPEPVSDRAITLSTLNRTVDGINNSRLMALKGPHSSFTATVTMKPDAPRTLKPLRQVPAVEVLELRPGARVMMLNNDRNNLWVNGSLGTFREVIIRNNGAEALIVELDSGATVTVPRHIWELIDYEQSGNAWNTKLLATVEQFPVRLGWAVTVHKSQGLSLPEVHFNLDWVFEAGQTYVALSRATSLKGLTVSKPLRNKHLMVSPAVKQFYQGLVSKPKE